MSDKFDAPVRRYAVSAPDKSRLHAQHWLDAAQFDARLMGRRESPETRFVLTVDVQPPGGVSISLPAIGFDLETSAFLIECIIESFAFSGLGPRLEAARAVARDRIGSEITRAGLATDADPA